jgi:hypothetical protein
VSAATKCQLSETNARGIEFQFSFLIIQQSRQRQMRNGKLFAHPKAAYLLFLKEEKQAIFLSFLELSNSSGTLTVSALVAQIRKQFLQ